MNTKYGIVITRRHRELVAMLNGGVTPDDSMFTGKYWLTFEIEEDGKDSINHEIVRERQLFQTHDIVGHFPVIARIKKD